MAAVAHTRRGPLSLAMQWLIASLITAAALGEVEKEAEAAVKEDNSTRPYVAPNVEGLHWVETFDGAVMSRWTASANEKYNGRFEVSNRMREGLIGDTGLLVPIEAQHYGISSKIPALVGASEVPFVFQFEVQFQEGHQCGGAYVKLFDSNGTKAEAFEDSTRFVIMFGPDRCGENNKVHFILQHQNPKTGKWEEKHLQDPPRVADDRLTHLYGLVINPDNSFEVQVDGVKKASGDLLTSMSPSINPPKEVDDSADSKPSDWVEEAKMNDPSASKPDDWDEDEPYSIDDPSATIPDGWREDVTPGQIPDPAATTPADWDEEEDGEWEAPSIDNPACKVGCGKWKPPTISNPKYKGKWSAPKVDNPAYKGMWKPRQIANPDYFEDKAPCILPKIDSVGIDIWTMQKAILFDNFVIATDPKRVAEFAEETWRIRNEIEELQKPKPETVGVMGGLMDTLQTYMIPIGVTALILIISTLWCGCCRNAAPPPRRPARSRAESPTPAKAQGSGEVDPAETQEPAEPKEEKKEDKKDAKSDSE